MTPRAVATVDEGQARGEIATAEDGRPKSIGGANTYEDLGLEAYQVSEARLVRDVLGEAGVRD